MDKLVLVVPEAHPLGPKAAHRWRRCSTSFVALARSASLTRKVMAAAESVGRTPYIRVQVRSFDAMCRLVASSIGIAILPHAAAALYTKALPLTVVNINGIDADRVLLIAAAPSSRPRGRHWSTCSSSA